MQVTFGYTDEQGTTGILSAEVEDQKELANFLAKAATASFGYTLQIGVGCDLGHLGDSEVWSD